MLYLTTTLYYVAHSSEPWFHSWYNPIIRISKNNILVIVHIIIFDLKGIIVIGKINAISTSKIKKIIAIKKNRKEKGRREDLIGSNPHSKGDLFSRSSIFFLDKILVNIITIKEIIIIIIDIKLIIKIIYSKI